MENRDEIVKRALSKIFEEFTEEKAGGAVIQVMGPVVDVEFKGGFQPSTASSEQAIKRKVFHWKPSSFWAKV